MSTAIDQDDFDLGNVSTGHLPPAAHVQRLIEEAHHRFRFDASGENSQVYPALARVPSDLFGVCVVGTQALFMGPVMSSTNSRS